MKKENLFYLVMILAVLVVRISVAVVPDVEINILDAVIHHFWFGVIFIVFGFLIPKRKSYLKILLYGVGAGLVIDQLVFMVLGAGEDKEYWALPSLLGAIVLAFIIFPIRRRLVGLILRERVE